MRGSFGFEEESSSGCGVGLWDEGFGVDPCPGTKIHRGSSPITKVSPLSELVLHEGRASWRNIEGL